MQPFIDGVRALREDDGERTMEAARNALKLARLSLAAQCSRLEPSKAAIKNCCATILVAGLALRENVKADLPIIKELNALFGWSKKEIAPGEKVSRKVSSKVQDIAARHGLRAAQ